METTLRLADLAIFVAIFAQVGTGMYLFGRLAQKVDDMRTSVQHIEGQIVQRSEYEARVREFERRVTRLEQLADRDDAPAS